MKKISTLTLSLSLSLSPSLLKADYWTQKANYPGAGLEYPFSFSIGNKGYVGCGAGASSPYYQKDFWEYDPSTNVWTQKADFGGVARYAATGFSIGNKGYAGLGETISLFNDFWEYDVTANTWTQKANFGGTSRYGAAGFAIGNFGYICAGGVGTTNHNDLWQYNPITDAWTQKVNMPGPPRRNTNGFAIGNNGYVIGGYDGSSVCFNDLWEYNSVLDAWTQKASFPDTARCDAAAFSICDKGYYGTGEDPNAFNGFFKSFWEYNPATNIWIQKTMFPGLKRDEPAYFSIGNKGYLGAGCNHFLSLYSDFWEYTPDSACPTGIDEFINYNLQFTIAPNPAKEFIVVSYSLAVKENLEVTISNAQGKKVFETRLSIINNQSKISLTGFSNGIYFVEINDGKQKAVRKFVKE